MTPLLTKLVFHIMPVLAYFQDINSPDALASCQLHEHHIRTKVGLMCVRGCVCVCVCVFACVRACVCVCVRA